MTTTFYKPKALVLPFIAKHLSFVSSILSALCFLLCLPVTEVCAQALQGSVMANDTASIPFATVYLPQLQRGTITDANGRFVVDSLPHGTYAVEFSSLGYRTLYDTLTFDGTSIQRNVVLPELAITLQEVFVSNGEDPAYAILRKVQAADGLYANRVKAYEAIEEARYEQNYSKMPAAFRRLMKTMAFMSSYRKTVNLLFKYPELAFSVTQTSHYANSKLTGETQLTKCNAPLTDKEKTSLLKMVTESDYLSWSDGKSKPWGADRMKRYDFELVGIYHEGNHDVDVISFHYKNDTIRPLWHGEIHVVEDVWRVVKYEYHSPSWTAKIECREVRSDLFLPVTMLAETKTTFSRDSVGGSFAKGFTASTGTSIQYRSITTQ